MKKLLSTLSVVVFTIALSANSSAQDNGPLVYSSYDRFPVFIADYYLRIHPEIRNRCGGSYKCAHEHFFFTGINAGYSKGSPTFDLTAYAVLNPNLAKNLNHDPIRFVMHYMNHGVYEERKATFDVFDPDEYIRLNPDVKNMHGNSDRFRAVWHWYHHGVNEGRASSDEFSVKEYINNYSDLRNKFRNDFASGLVHWEVYGRSEGRTKTN